MLQLTKVAELLLEKETISNADITNLIGGRAFSQGKEYTEYVNAGAGWGKDAAASDDVNAADGNTSADGSGMISAAPA